MSLLTTDEIGGDRVRRLEEHGHLRLEVRGGGTLPGRHQRVVGVVQRLVGRAELPADVGEQLRVRAVVGEAHAVLGLVGLLGRIVGEPAALPRVVGGREEAEEGQARLALGEDLVGSADRLDVTGVDGVCVLAQPLLAGGLRIVGGLELGRFLDAELDPIRVVVRDVAVEDRLQVLAVGDLLVLVVVVLVQVVVVVDVVVRLGCVLGMGERGHVLRRVAVQRSPVTPRTGHRRVDARRVVLQRRGRVGLRPTRRRAPGSRGRGPGGRAAGGRSARGQGCRRRRCCRRRVR